MQVPLRLIFMLLTGSAVAVVMLQTLLGWVGEAAVWTVTVTLACSLAGALTGAFLAAIIRYLKLGQNHALRSNYAAAVWCFATLLLLTFAVRIAIIASQPQMVHAFMVAAVGVYLVGFHVQSTTNQLAASAAPHDGGET